LGSGRAREDDADMKCPGCGSDNPAGKRFCGDCGTALESRCSQCGADNPPSKKFVQQIDALLAE
jgi:predicted amidophosphoribosyltransferase